MATTEHTTIGEVTGERFHTQGAAMDCWAPGDDGRRCLPGRGRHTHTHTHRGTDAWVATLTPAEILPAPSAPGLRDVLGLPAEPGGSPSIRAGSLLKGDEVKALDAAMRAAVQASATEPALAAELGDDYAGSWLDPATATLMVGVAGTPPAPEVGNGIQAPLRWESRPAERNLAELETAWAQVPALMSESSYRLVGSGLDFERNQVIVEVAGDLEGAATDLAPLGDAVAVRPGEPAHTQASSRTNPGNPPAFEAALRLDRVNAGFTHTCTAAFRVRDENNLSQSLALTAGHCNDDNDNGWGETGNGDWKVGTTVLGSVTANALAPVTSADASVIPIGTSWNDDLDCIYVAPYDCQDITTFGDPIQGSVVCQSNGMSDSLSCGVVESVNWNHDFPDAHYELTHAARHRQVWDPWDDCPGPGDSGAPVYQWDPPAYGGTVAVGVYAGGGGDCGPPGRVSYFSRWSKIRAGLGVVAPPGMADRAAPTMDTAATMAGHSNTGKRRVWLFQTTSGRLSFTAYDPSKAGRADEAWEEWGRYQDPGGWEFRRNPTAITETEGTATTNDDKTIHVVVPTSDGKMRYLTATAEGGQFSWDTSAVTINPPSGKVVGDVHLTVNSSGGELFMRDMGSGTNDKNVWWLHIADWDNPPTSAASWVQLANPTGRRPYGGLAAGVDLNGSGTADDVIDVFAIFDDRSVRHNTRTGGGSWSGWSTLSAHPDQLAWAKAGMTVRSGGNLAYFAAAEDDDIGGSDDFYLWALRENGSGWGNWELFDQTAPPYGPRGGVSAALGPPTASSQQWVYAFGASVSNQRSFYLHQTGAWVDDDNFTNWCATFNDTDDPCPEEQ